MTAETKYYRFPLFLLIGLAVFIGLLVYSFDLSFKLDSRNKYSMVPAIIVLPIFYGAIGILILGVFSIISEFRKERFEKLRNFIQVVFMIAVVLILIILLDEYVIN